jgi:hypothetical protein
MEFTDAVAEAKARIHSMFPQKDLAFRELWVYTNRGPEGNEVIVVGGEIALRKDLSRFRFEYEKTSGSTLRVWFDGRLRGAMTRSGGYRWIDPAQGEPSNDGNAPVGDPDE